MSAVLEAAGPYVMVFCLGMVWGQEFDKWLKWFFMRKYQKVKDGNNEVVKTLIRKLSVAEKFGGQIVLKDEGLKLHREVIQYLAKEAKIK